MGSGVQNGLSGFRWNTLRSFTGTPALQPPLLHTHRTRIQLECTTLQGLSEVSLRLRLPCFARRTSLRRDGPCALNQNLCPLSSPHANRPDASPSPPHLAPRS